MRSANKKKQKLYYATPSGETVPAIDGNGDETGDYLPGYSAPERFLASISPNRGESHAQPFGRELDYTRTIYTTDRLPIGEGARIWHETAPPDGANDGKTADYYVAAVSRDETLGSTAYALKAVTKDG